MKKVIKFRVNLFIAERTENTKFKGANLLIPTTGLCRYCYVRRSVTSNINFLKFVTDACLRAILSREITGILFSNILKNPFIKISDLRNLLNSHEPKINCGLYKVV